MAYDEVLFEGAQLALIALFAYEDVPNNEAVTDVLSILPVTNIDPVMVKVSALVSNIF